MPLAGLIAQMSKLGTAVKAGLFGIENMLESGVYELFSETAVGDLLSRGIKT